MSFDATLDMAGRTATIRLAGSLDTATAPMFREVIEQASTGPLELLVLNMENLSYMSSAGLRCLLFARQKMGEDTRVMVLGANPEVSRTIRLTGFDQSITMSRHVAD
ncbi:STAS domain-containing protein [Actinorugispora endophytica]|uniref:Anti-sigma factor antagonist n=1 Tax=Actinorugispora endophytica TaxID=1605990 RepID=A0A4R6UK18_9ACTN|nr:STAS domain-containing protein [Actinorugispora endophytica]TDQ46902.1 anti-anti-sigma factor [Actinorugispora endophytica]